METTSACSLQSSRFWLGFLAVSLLAVFIALQLQEKVDPPLSANITFSRQQAEEAALQIQRQLFPELDTQRSAATFLTDNELLNYVQLEAGGVPAYAQLLEQLDAATHGWRVRRFTPGQQHELRVDFSARGEHIGFVYILPAQEPGAALQEAEARAIAEAGALQFLGERFRAYAPLQTEQTTQASGRIDHSFTYQHATLTAGEARFRYLLTLAGDRLVRVEARKFIPQGFSQRFGEIRALNVQISQVSSLIAQGVFGIALIASGVWLFRRHQLLYRAALIPAAVVAVGLAAAAIANLPVAWFGYRTTTAVQSFLLQQATNAAVLAVGTTLVLALVFAVAEGLTRLAFADHPRLFDTCRPEVAGTKALAGRILGGYGWTGLFLLYAMAFALLRNEVLHWWEPTGIDSNPNILASLRPALAPIFTALQAGTLEECLFRAVPLALAVLIGNHYGIRKPLVVAVMLLQCLVFAGAHANYPNLPGYSRLVELLLPSLAFGLVYLRFGLLPGVLAHFEYDLVLMSMPIFVADSSNLWLDRVLIVLAGAAPLLLVLWAWKHQGGWLPLASQWRNGTVHAVPADPASEVTLHPSPVNAGAALVIDRRVLWGLAAIALLITAYVLLRPPRVDWPAYQVRRADAELLAEQALAARGVQLQGEWRRITTLGSGVSAGLDYVWRQSGSAAVQSLLGTWLRTPPWVVSWRRFDGPVEQRAEQWQARIGHDGRVLELAHQLPEESAGATLSADQAREIAEAWIREEGWARVDSLHVKSLRERKRPARSDWELVFLDKDAYAHDEASAAIVVRLAGDEVVGYTRTLDVPEAWARELQQRNSTRLPFRIVMGGALVALLGCAASAYFRPLHKRKFSLAVAWPWMLLVIISTLGSQLMGFDALQLRFQTTMAWSSQLALLVGGLLFSAALLAGVLFMAAQALHGERPRVDADLRQDLRTGVLLGICLAGLQMAVFLLPVSSPPLPGIGELSARVPVLAALLRGLSPILTVLLTTVLCIGLSRFMQQRWQKILVAALLLLYLAGNAGSTDDWLRAVVGSGASVLAGLLTVLLLRRHQLGVALAMLSSSMALGALTGFRTLSPDAGWHTPLTVAMALLVGYALIRHWYRHGTWPA